MLREGQEKNRQSGGALQGRLSREDKYFIHVWWKGRAVDWLERMGEGISKRGEKFISPDEQVLLWRLGYRLAWLQPEALSRGAMGRG